MIDRFLRSPWRAHRWFFCFISLTLVFIFLIFRIEANTDVHVIFYLPLPILIIPCAYLGFVADDNRLKRIIDLIINLH